MNGENSRCKKVAIDFSLRTFTYLRECLSAVEMVAFVRFLLIVNPRMLLKRRILSEGLVTQFTLIEVKEDSGRCLPFKRSILIMSSLMLL